MTEDRISVLLVDDDEDDFVIIRDILSDIRPSVFELHWANGYRDARKMIYERYYDICLMDYRLGKFDGIELMQEFISRGFETPIIILTGKGDHDIDLLAMEKGAVDYLEKANLEAHLLERAIRYAIRNSAMLKVLRASEAKLKDLSNRILAAQENDRKTVARELHDSIGSSLAAIRFSLGQRLKGMDQSELKAGKISFERIMDMIKATMEETQRISSNLRPTVLDKYGLQAAVRSFCKDYEDIYKDIRVEAQLDIREDDIPENLKIICYRIIQEAAHNAVKHGGAEHLLLHLSGTDGDLKLYIQDNGKGFDVQETMNTLTQTASMWKRPCKKRIRITVWDWRE